MEQSTIALTVTVFMAVVQTVVLTWIGWKVLFKLGPRRQTIMLTVVTVVVLSMVRDNRQRQVRLLLARGVNDSAAEVPSLGTLASDW